MTDYFSIDAVNWSTLKLLRESAMAYRYGLTHQREESAALAMGRLVHSLVFEPETFGRDYAIWEGGRRQGKEWDEFKAQHDGKTIFKADEIDEATAMADAVRLRPLVAPYLEGGQFEQPLMWTDEVTGLRCKARPDWILPDQRILLDLKTTVSIEGRRFGNAAARYGYHCQLAHYANGVERALGWRPEQIKLVAVEKTAPYDVGIFNLVDADLYAGQAEVAELLEKLRAHRAADLWPGRYVEEQALQLPAWVFLEDEDADADGFGLVVGD